MADEGRWFGPLEDYIKHLYSMLEVVSKALDFTKPDQNQWPEKATILGS